MRPLSLIKRVEIKMAFSFILITQKILALLVVSMRFYLKTQNLCRFLLATGADLVLAQA